VCMMCCFVCVWYREFWQGFFGAEEQPPSKVVIEKEFNDHWMDDAPDWCGHSVHVDEMGVGERSRTIHDSVLHMKMHESNGKHVGHRTSGREWIEHDHGHDMDELGMATRSRDLQDSVAHRKMHLTNANHVQNRPDTHRVSGRGLKVEKLISVNGPQVGKQISGKAAEALYGSDWCDHSHEVDELGNLYRRHHEAVLQQQMEAHNKENEGKGVRRKSVKTVDAESPHDTAHPKGHRKSVMSAAESLRDPVHADKQKRPSLAEKLADSDGSPPDPSHHGHHHRRSSHAGDTSESDGTPGEPSQEGQHRRSSHAAKHSEDASPKLKLETVSEDPSAEHHHHHHKHHTQAGRQGSAEEAAAPVASAASASPKASPKASAIGGAFRGGSGGEASSARQACAEARTRRAGRPRGAAGEADAAGRQR